MLDGCWLLLLLSLLSLVVSVVLCMYVFLVSQYACCVLFVVVVGVAASVDGGF